MSKHISNLLILLVLTISACTKQPEYFLTQGEIFHTTTHIKYQYDRDLRNEIFARLDCFDLSLNPFNPRSILYQVNNNQEVEVDDWFIAVFRKAQEIATLTGGAYDVTCAPLVNLWGFGFEKQDTISTETIDSLLQFVGYQKIWLENRKVKKSDPRVKLDFSSIAKGYAVDVTAELLESYGIKNYMVEIGGEVRAKGKNPEGEIWKIAITKPIEDSTGMINEQQQVVELEDYAIATSGNYRNFYIKDSKKYAHTIDLQTGYPVETNVLSASVFAPDCMTADAWATACMALGVEKFCALAAKIPKLEYYLLYVDDCGNWQEKQFIIRCNHYLQSGGFGIRSEMHKPI
ncbi:FAD:protein FMN transferase [Bacteroidia bacterium]|nr:FAD:protein FMN transferase [Bacteroidia bacterium]GHU70672.1 FAD:protein FMN transferase [Bacteroidia bacterium]